jgi:hypothetical protein
VVFEKDTAVWMPYLLCNKLWLNEGYKLPTYILLIDHEKAYDNVNREMLGKF